MDTMPVLAWSLKQARSWRDADTNKEDSKVVKFFIRHQAVLYFPILLVARLSWLNESFKTAFEMGGSSKNAAIELKEKGLQYPKMEKIAIAVHHLWVMVLCSGFGKFSIPYALAYFFISTCSSGLFLAVVFGLGHNGMSTYDANARPDFWKLQVTTTRNITGGHGVPKWFVNWICGGLQYQVDHHLFPMMPRHHLPKAHELVESFCKEWGVTYHETDIWDGTVEVIEHLSKVSDDFFAEFVTDFPAM